MPAVGALQTPFHIFISLILTLGAGRRLIITTTNRKKNYTPVIVLEFDRSLNLSSASCHRHPRSLR